MMMGDKTRRAALSAWADPATKGSDEAPRRKGSDRTMESRAAQRPSRRTALEEESRKSDAMCFFLSGARKACNEFTPGGRSSRLAEYDPSRTCGVVESREGWAVTTPPSLSLDAVPLSSVFDSGSCCQEGQVGRERGANGVW